MNRNQALRWLPLFSICALLSSPSVWAQDDADAAEQSPSTWGLGAGVMATKKPYRDFDNKAEAIPLVTYENQWVHVFGPNLEVKIPSAGPVSFSLNARYALDDGYKATDSSFLAGMDKRKAGTWLGASASWHRERSTWSAAWMGDATGESKGQQIRLSLEKQFQVGRFVFAPRFAATWLDSKYVNYYYGVKSSEATAWRPQYSGGSTVNTELALHSMVALSPKQSLSLDVGVTRLGSSIKDSPLVDRSKVPAVRLFYLYRF